MDSYTELAENTRRVLKRFISQPDLRSRQKAFQDEEDRLKEIENERMKRAEFQKLVTLKSHEGLYQINWAELLKKEETLVEEPENEGSDYESEENYSTGESSFNSSQTSSFLGPTVRVSKYVAPTIEVEDELEGYFQIRDYRGNYIVPLAASTSNFFSTNFMDLFFQNVTVTCSIYPNSEPWKIVKSVAFPGSYTVSTLFNGKKYYWKTSQNLLNRNDLCLNDGDPQGSECFILEEKGGKHAIKSICNELYLCCENGNLVVDRQSPQHWEQFLFIKV